nr:DNA/RNA non-specific endonuclease [uncultured Carboxylicivirga sp.]
MKTHIFITIIIFEFSSILAQQPCSPSESSGQVYHYKEFSLSYDEDNEQPEWVSYVLTAEELNIPHNRCNCFEEDKTIITGSATLEDYKGSGFDRGHLSPSADNRDSESNRESYLLSNMSPMLNHFNSGIWNMLEDKAREQARVHGEIYITTGSLIKCNLGKIGENQVSIPDYFWKCLMYEESGKFYSIAFLIPHIGADSELKNYAIPVNVIESLTGLNIFPCSNEKQEHQFSLKRWGM